MIIKTKNSDFSASGFGVLEYLDEKTLALLTSTGRTFTTLQKYALQDFLTKIGYIANNGIYAKSVKMFMPVIADGLVKSFFNLKTGAYDYPAPYTGANIATSDYIYDAAAKGFHNNQSAVAPFKVGTYNLGLYPNNLSVASYISTVGLRKRPAFGNGNNRISGSDNFNYNNGSDSALFEADTPSQTKKISIMSASGIATGNVKVWGDGAVMTVNETILGSPTALVLNNMYFMARATGYNYILCNPCQFIMVGTAITPEEAEILREALATAMPILLA